MQSNSQELFYSGPRGKAVKILNRVDRMDAYLDKVLDFELKSDDLNDADRRLLAELVHGVLRWKGKLDYVLNGFYHGNFTNAETNVKNAMRVGLYQVFFLQRVPPYAAVDEAVEFIKKLRGEKSAGVVNGVLRSILRTKDGIHYPDAKEAPVYYLSVMLSHPAWMVKRWYERFGFDEASKLLAKNNERPPLTIRVNTAKIAAEELEKKLTGVGIEFERSNLVPSYLRVHLPPGIHGMADLDLFRDGLFTIQDESTAFPVLLLNPGPGQRVIDLAAAPGGKTAFIAELMKGEGEVIAVDRYETKLKLLAETCERLGARNVRCVTADAATLDVEPADGVILDAPCSGLGVLRKKPDSKWKREPEDIAKLASIQRGLLDNAAKLVKSGGILVYSTCTIEPEENLQQVGLFLERHPEFSVDDPSPFVPRAVLSKDGRYVETLPHIHDMDGSFAVRLKRV
ncbi:MAG: 16S rRNA (cytosine(967)-C(5))-methyltransferase RsmB [Ignavibacteriales bacterium CG07_land_8_20_14_0_80_59_12]|nr:MAG: 16S rRNA (cytosine(967)-C(5))-methyltransferase RsmB [Ignavibacteriales bacterium CG07_land_8_20_14_0_80_59_12]